MRAWRELFRKPAPAELDRELQFHIEELIQEKVSRGVPPDQARREARLEFGGAASIREELNDVHRIPILDATLTHLRYAWRALCAAPTFSLTVIVTLTLGIGANTTVFSAIDAVLLRPLPYPDSDRLVVIEEFETKQKSLQVQIAPTRLEDWNRLNGAFEAISGYYTEDTTDATGGNYFTAEGKESDPPPVKIRRAYVAPRFLQVLGVSPALGHDFTEADTHFHGNASRSVLISDRYWHEYFHADPNIIGKPLLHGKNSAIVIGVMPRGFTFPEEAVDLWYVDTPDAPWAQDRRYNWYTGIGRLKPGVTEAQARVNLELVQRNLARQFPATDAEIGVWMRALKETTVASARSSLWLLFGAVSLLLLVACTNVSALVLARGMERDREFSLRVSLGASRATILTQVLAETLLLAVAGTIAGLALAAGSSRVLGAMAKSVPRIGEIGFDWRMFVYSAVCAVTVALVSGLFPALRASMASPAGALARGGRSQVSSRRPARWVMVGVQVAFTVCLLSGAGLVLRSFESLWTIFPGFDASRVLAFRVTGANAEFSDVPKLRQSVFRTMDALASLPGVQRVAASTTLPGAPSGFPIDFSSPDSGLDPATRITVDVRLVSEGYFSTMGIPILAGTPCDRRTEGVLVNRKFVSTYFAGRDPVGHHLVVNADSPDALKAAILGVAGDAREFGLNTEVRPTAYWCAAVLDPGRYYLVRTPGDPASLAGAVRQRMHAVEPGRAVYDLAPLTAHLSDAFAEVRLRTLLLSLFAATALSLACVGLYGTMSYVVTARRREIGVRMALGAARRQIGMRFVAPGMAVAAGGAVAGLLLAAWSARFISGMLYHVRPNDAISLSSAVAAMLVVALLASAVPAIRAARIDPIESLREE